jgi:hypothetical protein
MPIMVAALMERLGKQYKKPPKQTAEAAIPRK